MDMKILQILSDRMVYGAFGVGLGLLGNIGAAWMTGTRPQLTLPLALLIVGTLAAGLGSLYLLRRSQFEIILRTPLTLRAEADKGKYQRTGVLVFLSLYSDPRVDYRAMDAKAKAQYIKALWDAIDEQKYDALNMDTSNVATAVKAITSHGDKLKHCWIISTMPLDDDRSKPPTGSLSYAPLLARYLTEKHNLKCEFHDFAVSAIPQVEDALMTAKTKDVVTKILDEARAKKLAMKELVADFTSCPRHMVLGMILACLEKGCNLQFIGTKYVDGKPTSDHLPYVFPFEPRVHNQ
jgi:hypothetical protein